MDGYEIIRSKRKTIAVEIRGDGSVLVRAPYRMGSREIQSFIDSKTEWIARHLKLIRERQACPVKYLTKEEIRELANRARDDIRQRVERYAPYVGVSPGKITIRSQKTRWGSCSAQGNLSFNCLLMLCPEEVRDYVAVHELCHCIEFNHSSRFWKEVERVLPEYKASRKWLKENGDALIRRLG